MSDDSHFGLDTQLSIWKNSIWKVVSGTVFDMVISFVAYRITWTALWLAYGEAVGERLDHFVAWKVGFDRNWIET